MAFSRPWKPFDSFEFEWRMVKPRAETNRIVTMTDLSELDYLVGNPTGESDTLGASGFETFSIVSDRVPFAIGQTAGEFQLVRLAQRATVFP